MFTSASGKIWLYAAVGIAIPYILRTIQGRLMTWFGLKICDGFDPCTECYNPTKNKDKEKLLESSDDSEEVSAAKKRISEFVRDTGADASSFPSVFNVATISWTEARIAMGYTPKVAIAVSILRVFFWHWLQPLIYGLVLFSFYPQLNLTQFILGLCVAFREAMYFLLVLVGAFACPAFLLTNPHAFVPSERNRWVHYMFFLFGYVCCPEKLVFACVWKRFIGPFAGFGSKVVGITIPLLDICGIVGLILGIVHHNLPIALEISYGVTTLAAIVTFAIPCIACCTDKAEDRTKSPSLSDL